MNIPIDNTCISGLANSSLGQPNYWGYIWLLHSCNFEQLRLENICATGYIPHVLQNMHSRSIVEIMNALV